MQEETLNGSNTTSYKPPSHKVVYILSKVITVRRGAVLRRSVHADYYEECNLINGCTLQDLNSHVQLYEVSSAVLNT